MIRSGAHYMDQVFDGIVLEHAHVAATGFYDCTFGRCSFAETTFERCRFVGCVFQHCDLSLVQLPSCSFAGTRFECSKVMGVDWTKAYWPATTLRDPLGFFRSAISHSTFIGLNLRRVQIQDCLAVDVDFRETDLSQADLSGIDLSDSLFLGTDLTEADLARARNYRIDPGQNTLRQAKFSLPEAMSLLYELDIVLSDG